MLRRKFLKSGGIAAAAALAAPVFLPAGRLFAYNANRKVNHVVICLLKGGVRNQESVLQHEGNLMPHLFNGSINYRDDLSSALSANKANLGDPVFTDSLQNQGTLFKKFTFPFGSTSHNFGTSVLLNGTFHEPSFDDASAHIIPYLNNVYGVKNESVWLLRNNEAVNASGEKIVKPTGSIVFQNGISHNPIPKFSQDNPFEENNLLLATEIIQSHTPELMIVECGNADVAHYDFTGYCKSLQNADYAIACIWNSIQRTKKMSDDTVIIVLPEFGRNNNHNGVMDAFGRYGFDHSASEPVSGGDQNAREMFCLIAGPKGVVQHGLEISEPVGNSAQILPLAASLLGYEIKMRNKGGIAETNLFPAII